MVIIVLFQDDYLPVSALVGSFRENGEGPLDVQAPFSVAFREGLDVVDVYGGDEQFNQFLRRFFIAGFGIGSQVQDCCYDPFRIVYEQPCFLRCVVDFLDLLLECLPLFFEFCQVFQHGWHTLVASSLGLDHFRYVLDALLDLSQAFVQVLFFLLFILKVRAALPGHFFNEFLDVLAGQVVVEHACYDMLEERIQADIFLGGARVLLLVLFPGAPQPGGSSLVVPSDDQIACFGGVAGHYARPALRDTAQDAGTRMALRGS